MVYCKAWLNSLPYLRHGVEVFSITICKNAGLVFTVLAPPGPNNICRCWYWANMWHETTGCITQHGNILQNYSEIFPAVSFLPPGSWPSVPSWVGDRMCLEINPEETNGDLNMSYVKIAIVMSQDYITSLGSHSVRYWKYFWLEWKLPPSPSWRTL